MLNDLDHFSLPETEEKVLKFWKEHDILQKTLDISKEKKGKPFRFFEGPPTANGKPGIHHVLARAFKDIVLRYKTMRGYAVTRKAGWDTHGLPVEIAVEKELGIKKKSEIEKFGIAEFNERAKASVWQYKGEWEKLTERIGFWLDFKNPYITYENSYVETLWWIFGEIHKRGLLKKFHKIVPWCPRCETTLSSHELAQPGGYKRTKDPSVYVVFELQQKKKTKTKESLLVWTTTPWTLPANMAIAINPKLIYTKYKIGEEYFWSLKVPPNHKNLPMAVIEKCSGKKFVGMRYTPLYPTKRVRSPFLYKILAGDFVLGEEGTGMVHIAPASGEDDMKVWREVHGKREAPLLVTITDQAVVKEGYPGAGKYIKEADKDIMKDLEDRGLLYHESTIEHEYPFCWRCGSALIYFARKAWFILMSKLRADLVAANETIGWIPSHLKEGRFGEWLKEAKDWAISRERYWGTPLPIWECDRCETHTVIPSLKTLDERLTKNNRFFLVRHGEADHNIQNYFAGGAEIPSRTPHLTEQGKKEAEAMGKALKKQGVKIIVSSPYTRTKETAKIIAKITGAKIVIDKRLGEIDGGMYNGRPMNEYWAFYANPLDRFVKAPPGGEAINEVKKRMWEAFREINAQYEEKAIAIVSHGDPLWTLEGVLKHLSPQEMIQLPSSRLAPGEFREVSFLSGPYTQKGELDLHRPYVDELTFPCEECGKGSMSRVKEVADVWFDSGAMPFAEWHYPFENHDAIDKKLQFPADYIAEGIDQTRGWFYSLLNIGILLKKGPAYKHVISLGLLLDKQGQKMSKSKGNVVDPWEMIQKYGVDAIRWYFFTVNDPGEPKRFDEEDIAKTLRKCMTMLYHSFSFWDMYAAGRPKIEQQKNVPKHKLDVWVLARLEETIKEATRHLDHYDIGRGARLLEMLIDDLSHWYIRRSRRRIGEGDSEALQILGTVFLSLAKLIAPFAPFMGEALYQSVGKRMNTPMKISVHLDSWPEENPALQDKKIIEAMARVRTIASVGLKKRSEARIKVRQPLASLTVSGMQGNIENALLEMIKDEVNVKSVRFEEKRGAKDDDMTLDTVITPELRTEGMVREVIRTSQQLRQDAGLKVGEPITLSIQTTDTMAAILKNAEEELRRVLVIRTLTIASLESKRPDHHDAMLETKIEDEPITLFLLRETH